MPLTFDEVGEIVDQVLASTSGDRFARVLQVRRVIGQRVFASVGIDLLPDDLRDLMVDIDLMMPELNFYGRYEGELDLRETLPKILGFMQTTLGVSSYLTEHSSDFPDRFVEHGNEIATTMQMLIAEMEDLGDTLQQGNHVVIDPRFFKGMRTMGILFYRVALGDDVAHTLMTSMNQANRFAKIHIRVFLEAEDMSHES